MNHFFASAAVLAFLLGGASPGFAFPRVANFEWTAATGPVAGYAVYASIGGGVEALVATVAVPGASIDVGSGIYVSVRVAAYDVAGRFGPFSDRAPLVRLCPGDFDGNEVIDPTDLDNARACFGFPAKGFCAGADIDRNGSIMFSELHMLSVGSDACALAATPTVCLGDLDDDHTIGFADFSLARSCLDKLAQGVCAAADFDGDGFVSGFDVLAVRTDLGSDACALTQ